jgi:hypothetical protein
VAEGEKAEAVARTSTLKKSALKNSKLKLSLPVASQRSRAGSATASRLKQKLSFPS